MSAANSTLTQERLKELLHYNPETGAFIWISKPAPRANRIKVGSVAGSNKGNGYVQIQIDGKNYLAQRLAYLFVHGRMPVGDIDHSDGNPSNNRLSNLRDVTHAQNIQNQRTPNKRNTSGFIGISFRPDTSKYAAYISTDGKRKVLGCFDSAEDAHAAYLKAKRKLHEFCTI